MTVTLHYGFRLKPFAAVDVASRYRVGELYARGRRWQRVLQDHGEGSRPGDGAAAVGQNEGLGLNTSTQYISV